MTYPLIFPVGQGKLPTRQGKALEQAFARRRFAAELARAVSLIAAAVGQSVAKPAIRIRYWKEQTSPTDALLERDGRRIVVHLGDFLLTNQHNIALKRLPHYIYLLLRCPEGVNGFTVDYADGDLPGKALLSPSSYRDDVILVPDPVFYERNAYADMRAVADISTRGWQDRNRKLRWRGTDTGKGSRLVTPDAAANGLVQQRLRAALILKDRPDCDVKFSDAEHGYGYANRYRDAGVWGERIPPSDWINDRHALVIDGHSNSWSSLMERLHLGCCILKVDSPFGFRQWFYDRLVPWENFVPVSADLHDLEERIDWVNAREDEACSIASNGQALARSLTLQSETDDAVRRISAHFGIAA